MRQRVVIIVTIVVVLGLLAALNAAKYARADEREDSEWAPNRSTYNAGPRGTRALFDLLSESGYPVERWRESPVNLAQSGAQVSTFVIVGSTLTSVETEEAESLLRWVGRGGRLVIIDRAPQQNLMPGSDQWTFYTETINYPEEVDSANVAQMTDGAALSRPLQPTPLTRDVRSVRPSRFASVIRFNRNTKEIDKSAKPPRQEHRSEDQRNDEEDENSELPSPNSLNAVSPAPVAHLATPKGTLLLDYPHGAGRIVLLSDPYIVSNAGIGLEDNLQLAINAVASGKGQIAFDEYHQGHAASQNMMAAYFKGTPVLAIAGQLFLIILAIVWTRGRRFGRPLPLPQVDRRSSLEFVASMAELQQRARAFDLAIENVYSRTRRVLTRYAGVDYHSSRAEIAERVASRSSLRREQVESLMRSCEDAINGATISERQSVELVRRLRELEGALGLRMRSREVKQAAENI